MGWFTRPGSGYEAVQHLRRISRMGAANGLIMLEEMASSRSRNMRQNQARKDMNQPPPDRPDRVSPSHFGVPYISVRMMERWRHPVRTEWAGAEIDAKSVNWGNPQHFPNHDFRAGA